MSHTRKISGWLRAALTAPKLSFTNMAKPIPCWTEYLRQTRGQ